MSGSANMATRTSLSLEVRPMYTRSPPLRTLRYVAKERQLLGREKRSGRYAVKALRSSGASTDSTELEVESKESVTEDTSTESPEASQETAAGASLKEATDEEDTSGSSAEAAGYMARRPRTPLSELKEGDILNGVVKNVVTYGAFLDAGCALDVFVHVSDITNTYVEDAQNILKRGMKVKLKLIEAEHKLKASLKDLNTFDVEPSTSKPEKQEKKGVKAYPMADEFEGIVEEVKAQGALVKFDDGHATGYLPVEEIVTGKESVSKDVQAYDLLTPQQVITVRVIETDEKKGGRYTLSMREYEDIEFERKGKQEGFFVKADDSDDEGDGVILSAAFKKAGIVRDMFAGAEIERKKKKADVETVIETPAPMSVPTMSAAESEILSLFAPTEFKTAEVDVEATDMDVEAMDEMKETDVLMDEEEQTESAIDDVLEAETEEEQETETDEPIAEIKSFGVDFSDDESKSEEDPTDTVTADPVADIPSLNEPISENTLVEEKQAATDIPDTELKQESEETVEVPPPVTSIEDVEAAETPTDAPVTSEMPVTDAPPAAKASVGVSASLVKELREISGAGMMDCKKALTECNSDMDAAIDYLKKKGIASAAKRSGRVASEGIITSYIHLGNKLGILLEVNSETDFVARNEKFQTFVQDVAMSIAASPDAICIHPDDFPEDILNKERELEMSKDDLQNKPEAIKEKIVQGRLEKMKATASVLEQPFIQNQEITVQDALNDVTSALGEKIVIRRFVRYELGEGLEKKSTDFAAEVADQIEAKAAEAASKKDTVTEGSPAEGSPAEEAPTKEAPTVAVSAAMVKELRQMTGGGLMDCKRALIESEGDMDAAVAYLRMKGLAGAAKKAGRLASEGVICSYIHFGSRLGIMAEVNCETDFVARGDVFQQLAHDIAMQLAACPEVSFISSEDVPQDIMDREMQIEMEVEDLQSKPENIRESIAEGRVRKTIASMCLSDQAFLKDTEKTMDEVVKEHIAALGENIKIRRFVRFNLGEGIEKSETDFAKEVAEQTQQ